MITLKNQNMTVEISEMGAELQSILKNGKQYLWIGEPDIWEMHAPLIFPICGGLKDGKFIYNDKEYTMPKHGYAMNTLFEVEKVSATSLTLLHTSNEETLKRYPFTYEFRVIYDLLEDGIKITYDIKNKSEGDMYFSIGSHESYFTPEGIEDYDVIFPEKETLNSCALYGNFVTDVTVPIMKNSNVLPLYEKYFFTSALIFKELKSRSATLRNRKTGRFVHIEFPNKPYFNIWHKPNSPYICLEPWAGIPDSPDVSGKIEEKEGINRIPEGGAYNISHKITFGEE